MKKYFKKVLALVCATMITVSLAACGDTAVATGDTPTGGDSGNNARVEIEYWHVNNETFGGPAVEHLIAYFNQMQDGIYVHSRWNAGMYAGLMSNLQAEVAAGRFPAVVQVGWALIDYFENTFPFTDIATLVSSYTPDLTTWVDDNFLPSMLELAQNRDGNQLGLPYAVSTPVMFLNQDLLAEAGLDINGPATWEEVDYFARRVSEVTGRFGLYIQEPADSWATQALMESNGARMLSYVDGQIVASFAGTESAHVWEWYRDIVIDGAALHISWDEGVNAFVAGEVAMLYTTIARRQQIQNGANFQAAAIVSPLWEGQSRRIPTGGAMLAVLAQSPEERAAAWEFMRFMYSQYSIAEWVMGTGFIPPTRNVSTEEPRLAAFLQENPMMYPAISQLPYAVNWAPFPGENGLQAEQMMIDMRDRILGGEPNVGSLLQETQNAINAILN